MEQKKIRFISSNPKNKTFGQQMDEWFAEKLDEGYFKSYPETVVLRRLEKFLKKNYDKCGHFDIYPSSLSNPNKHDEENDFQLLTLATEKFSKKLEDFISNELSGCGWYIGSIDKEISDSGEKFFEFSLEPKFPNDSGSVEKKSIELIKKVKRFYHITFKNNEQKILKSGLLPSTTSRTSFKHPERIYLFTDKSIAEDFVKFHKTALLSFTASMNKRKISGGKRAKNKLQSIDADEKYQNKDSNEEPIIGFEVDLFKMMKDGKTVNLYHDNRFNERDKAYFTQNSISPKYLKKISV